jgi:cell division protein FtsN
MKIHIFIIAFLISLSVLPASAQQIDTEVQQYIKMIDQGDTEKASEESAALIAANPNNPAILYLEGRLSTDGTEALKYYQTILDNFSKSQWADDALYQTYQYYYALGYYKTANIKLEQLKKQYPDSPYLTSKTTEQVVAEKTQEEVPKNLPLNSEVQKPTPTSSLPVPVPPVATQSTTDLYTIQVGAFSTSSNADKQKTYFEELGYQVVITNKVKSGKSLFLVWVGAYPTAEDAVKASYEIKKKYNIESIVVQRY